MNWFEVVAVSLEVLLDGFSILPSVTIFHDRFRNSPLILRAKSNIKTGLPQLDL